MRTRGLALGGWAVVVLASTAGCFRAQARTAPITLPPLDAPAPPPRVVDPVVAATPEPVPLAGAPPQSTQIPRPAPPGPRADTAKPEENRADPAAADQPRAEEVPPRTVLQTTPAEREADVERTVRGLVARSVADLSRVDYGRLGEDARTQYDQAKRFASQADEALKAKNLVYASYLADKAATLAAQLAGR